MEINCEQLDGDIYKINLKGRMDIPGNEEIELKFSGMTAAPRMLFIVDLTEVNFIASIGIRTLLLSTCQWPTELSHYWPLILSHFPREKSLIQF